MCDVPVAQCALCLLQVLVEEKLADRAQHLGELFRQQLRGINNERVKTVRGRGMLNALVIQVRKIVLCAARCCAFCLFAEPWHQCQAQLVPMSRTRDPGELRGQCGVAVGLWRGIVLRAALRLQRTRDPGAVARATNAAVQ
jgi:hypothetical protein